MDTDNVLGPIDYMAVEFPGGHMTGEGFALLLDLVERDVIRALDLEFIAKSTDGTVRMIELGEVEHGGEVDITRWQDVTSGLLDASDRDQVASAIEPGSLAGILVYENIWAVPLMEALHRSTARLVGSGRIDVDEMLTVLGVSDSGSERAGGN
jgi:hypothetical protein